MRRRLALGFNPPDYFHGVSKLAQKVGKHGGIEAFF